MIWAVAISALLDVIALVYMPSLRHLGIVRGHVAHPLQGGFLHSRLCPLHG